MPSIVIAEGPLSAFASMWDHGAARALATGGTANLAAFDRADLAGLAGDVGDVGRVIVEADGDRAGRAAALACAARLRAAGYEAATVHRAAGGDALDEWGAALIERAAILEFDGGLPRLEAEWAAWRALGDLI